MDPTTASPAADAPSTRSDWAQAQLRELIISGQLPPRSKLTGTALSKRLRVSPTPLREALQRLSADGLVTMTPQRGARVSDVSATDAEEIYALRLRLEPDALRMSVLEYDARYERVVRAAYRRFLAAHRHRDGRSYGALEAHREFHAVLLAKCPSRWLLRIVNLLADHSMRYQALAMSGPPTIDSHEQLMAAALAGDADEAATLMEHHLRGTLTIVEAEAIAQTDRHT